MPEIGTSPLSSRFAEVRQGRGRLIPARAIDQLAIGSILLVLIFADLAVGGPMLTFDRLTAPLGVSRDSPYRPYGDLLDHVGLRAVTVPILLAVVLWVWRRGRGGIRPFVISFLSVLSVNLVVGTLKVVVGRDNPLSGQPELFNGGIMWPSGHAANVTMTAALVVYLLRSYGGVPIGRRLGMLIIGIPAVHMMVISAVLGYHWVSDLAAGWIVGLMVAITVVGVLDNDAILPEPERESVPLVADRGP
ncbi:MAG: phosphatase PAP2 family protein [Acidimicrobiales bacterium]